MKRIPRRPWRPRLRAHPLEWMSGICSVLFSAQESA